MMPLRQGSIKGSLMYINIQKTTKCGMENTWHSQYNLYIYMHACLHWTIGILLLFCYNTQIFGKLMDHIAPNFLLFIEVQSFSFVFRFSNSSGM